MVKRPLISVVCPFFNEEATVERLYARLREVLDAEQPPVDCRMLFIDDGSRDRTLERLDAVAAADPRVRVYALSRNFGHQAALSAGLDLARGDALVLMDADLQHPPELIREMLRKWREGFAVVAGLRQETADATWLKRATSNAFYRLFNLLSDVPIVPGVADFTLLSREAYRALRRLPERHRFLRGMIAWLGFPTAYVPYVAPPRTEGESKYSFRRMTSLAVDALVSFSVRPIRMAAKLGLTVAALGFLYLCYVVWRHLFLGDTVAGWPSILSTVIILGGLQLFFIGLIGEYIARSFEELKGRPLYVLKRRPRAASVAAAASGRAR